MKKTVLHTKLKPGVPFNLEVEKKVQISLAVLSPDPKPGKTILKVKVKGEEFVLCTLTRDVIEQQTLNVYFTALDAPTLILTGKNKVDLTYAQIEEDHKDLVPNADAIDYSALLGSLEDEDDISDDDTSDDDIVNYGRNQFRDVSDNRFLGGFELRHFGLAPQVSLFDKIDLRKEETCDEDKKLHDNILTGLINSMLNSGDAFQIRKAKELLKSREQESKTEQSSTSSTTGKKRKRKHGSVEEEEEEEDDSSVKKPNKKRFHT